MRGITEKRIREIYLKLPDTISEFNAGKHVAFEQLLGECKELNEPWMTLDEFLKSGFEGKCWIASKYGVSQVKFYDNVFCSDDEHECLLNDRIITRVQPIHKPEPPR